MALSTPPVNCYNADASARWEPKSVAQYCVGYFFAASAAIDTDPTSTAWLNAIAWVEEFKYWQVKLGVGDALPLMHWYHDTVDGVNAADFEAMIAYVNHQNLYYNMSFMGNPDGGYFKRSAGLNQGLAAFTGQWAEGKAPLWYGIGDTTSFTATEIVLDHAGNTLADAAYVLALARLSELGLSSICLSSERGQLANTAGVPAAPLGYRLDSGAFPSGVFVPAEWSDGSFDASVERYFNNVLTANPLLDVYLDETNATGHAVGEGVTDVGLVDVVVPITRVDPAVLDALIS